MLLGYLKCTCNDCFFIYLFLSLFSWGYPLLMLAVAAAFKYKERDTKVLSVVASVQTHKLNTDTHCWLMEGSAYTWYSRCTNR
jgi:hypothetical protein